MGLGHLHAVVEPPRPPGDARRLIGDPLQIRAELHRRDDGAQIDRHRLEAQQQFDAVLIHLLFEQIDLLVVGDHLVAQLAIALEQPAEGPLQIALRQARHHQHVLAQETQRLVERTEDVQIGRIYHKVPMVVCGRKVPPLSNPDVCRRKL